MQTPTKPWVYFRGLLGPGLLQIFQSRTRVNPEKTQSRSIDPEWTHRVNPHQKQTLLFVSNKQISIPGGGISSGNLERILNGSGAREFHGSARAAIPSRMEYRKEGISMGISLCPPEFSVKVTDKVKVQKLVQQGHSIKR